MVLDERLLRLAERHVLRFGGRAADHLIVFDQEALVVLEERAPFPFILLLLLENLQVLLAVLVLLSGLVLLEEFMFLVFAIDLLQAIQKFLQFLIVGGLCLVAVLDVVMVRVRHVPRLAQLIAGGVELL